MPDLTAPTPSPLATVRDVLLRIALVAMLVYLPVLYWVHASAWLDGVYDGWLAARFAVHHLALVPLALRRPPGLAASALIFYLLFAIAQAVITYGFAPAMGLLAMAATFVGYLFFGLRGLAVVGGLVVVTLAGTATLLTGGFVPPPAARSTDPTELSAWVRIGASHLLLIGGVSTALAVALHTSEREGERARAALAREREERAEREAAEAREQETRDALQQAERLEAVGRVASGAAHDLGNALAVVLGSAELLRDQELPDTAKVLLDEIIEGSTSAAATSRHLLTLARQDVAERERLEVGAHVRRIAARLRRILPEDIEIAVDCAPDLWIFMDRSHFERILTNLAVNARDAMAGGGHLRITASRHPDSEGVRLSVTDDGAGMTDHTAEHIFEPFFTTKSRGSGTGLGMNLVKRLVEEADGTIAVQSTLDAGTTIVVDLPPPPDDAARPPTDAPAPLEARQGLRVLLVEDQPAVRAVLTRALRRLGAEVDGFGDGASALDSMRENTHDLLVTDGIIPGTTSTADVLAAWRASASDRPAIVVSGHVEEELVRRGIEAGQCVFVAKPFTLETLRAAVGEALSP